MIYERRVKYYETDQMAIVHHSNYIRWFEEARIALMDEIGFTYKQMEAMGVQIPVLEVQCAYKSMVRFDDTVCIAVRIDAYTGARLSMTYEIRDKETGALRTTGSSGHCFINDAGRVISLKKALPEAHRMFAEEYKRGTKPE